MVDTHQPGIMYMTWTLKTPNRLRASWVIPPRQCRVRLRHGRDVLGSIPDPMIQTRPVVCLDETNKQLVAETRTPVGTRSAATGGLRYDGRT